MCSRLARIFLKTALLGARGEGHKFVFTRRACIAFWSHPIHSHSRHADGRAERIVPDSGCFHIRTLETTSQVSGSKHMGGNARKVVCFAAQCVSVSFAFQLSFDGEWTYWNCDVVIRPPFSFGTSCILQRLQFALTLLSSTESTCFLNKLCGIYRKKQT